MEVDLCECVCVCVCSYSLAKITFPFKTHKLFKLYIIRGRKKAEQHKKKRAHLKRNSLEFHRFMCA